MEEKRNVKQKVAPSHLREFEVYLPTVQTPVKKGKHINNQERIKANVITTDQILDWSDEAQARLRTELERVVSPAFPKMPEKEYKYIVESYFRQPGRKLHRQAILFRKETGKLIATAIFDQGEVEYEGNVIKGIYYILRAMLPEYQGFGLGQIMATKVLMELQPDILLATSYQSSSVHAWVKLPQKGLLTGFEVYPRIEQRDGKDVLITLPYKDLDFAISVFKQMFIGFLNNRQELLDKEVNNLTVHLIRKDTHGKIYDFHPWEKNGKEDTLAKALDLTDKDGVLIMFRKKE